MTKRETERQLETLDKLIAYYNESGASLEKRMHVQDQRNVLLVRLKSFQYSGKSQAGYVHTYPAPKIVTH